jgi:hypothetical protein
LGYNVEEELKEKGRECKDSKVIDCNTSKNKRAAGKLREEEGI